MLGKCVIVLCVANLLASTCAVSAQDAGLLPMGADFYLNRKGAEWYLDGNGHLHSVRSGWTGPRPFRGDEIMWEEKERNRASGGNGKNAKAPRENLAHAQDANPVLVPTPAPIGPASSDTRPTTATLDQPTAALDQQERCAMQAQRAFEELRADAQVGQTLLDEYRSHYYTRTGKCLMLIERNYVTDGHPAREDFHVVSLLIDANERRRYAAYEQTSPLKADIPPAHGATRPQPLCELIPSLREEKKCETREEFDAFVAGYLDE